MELWANNIKKILQHVQKWELEDRRITNSYALDNRTLELFLEGFKESIAPNGISYRKAHFMLFFQEGDEPVVAIPESLCFVKERNQLVRANVSKAELVQVGSYLFIHLT